MRLLYYSPASYGGIADYAHEQANALVELGIDVTLICDSKYPLNRGEKYKPIPILRDYDSQKYFSCKYLRAANYTKICLSNFRKIVKFIDKNKFHYVLFGSYSEYLAPIWSAHFRQLSGRGVTFGAVLHDPFREYIFGPHWWHRWSIASGYSFLKLVFIHQSVLPHNIGFPMSNLTTCVIPHGPYDFGKATLSKEAIREQFTLPINAKVLLSFGHIRDNKNLDLVLQAMVYLPDVHLIVAGKEQLSSQRPVNFYRTLAIDLGVADRCRWQHELVPSSEVPNLFRACDVLVLTYSKSFHSASGVLNAAVNYRKICVASSGEGPLKSVVDRYNLGVWVEPDSSSAIIRGIKEIFLSPPTPQWDKYLEDNSWAKNAQCVISSFQGNFYRATL